MDAIERAVEFWRTRGVSLNGPADESTLARLAEFFDGVLPSEVRRFYALADGMAEYETDGWWLSYWSVDRVLRECDVVIEGSTKWVAFGDFLIYSQCLRLGREGSGVSVAVDGSPERYPSLAAFFEIYLADPGFFGMAEVENR
jgi:hypothetical protein